MPKYDIELIKQALTSRHAEVIAKLSGVDISILDGEHHSCPKCGGTDRFNFSREGTGGVHCNQCQPGTGDTFGTIRWITGWDFGSTLEKVAAEVGVLPSKKKKHSDPAEHLDFLPWNQTVVGMWCLKKKPIKPDAVQAIGGRVAKYRGQYTVIAIPVWGPSGTDAEAVGWILYRADGGELPKGKKDSQEWVKVKLTAGSQAGIISKTAGSNGDGVMWKLEGSTDLLAMLSVNPNADAFTNANGASEKPLEWIVRKCEGKRVYVLHDADTPGQHGATYWPLRDGTKRPGWCPALARVASEARNVKLPFPVQDTHGQDLRDYLAGGGSYAGLLELADASSPFGKEETKAVSVVDESEDDPQRLARVNLERYKTEHDGRLIYWRDEWWKWKGGRYRKIELSELKAKVWASIRNEFEACWRERSAKGSDAPVKKVTRSLVSNVIGAMESVCGITSSIPMPCWMPDRSQPHYLATTNGILDLDAIMNERPASEFLQSHSSDWFSSFKLDYPFDENADCKRWEEYLNYSMEGDADRISLLQEWAGYLLTNRNDLQRFLVLEGEGKNGKTVFFAAMTAMLGADNVSHVSIESFGGRFDLATTLGKAANISGDAGEIEVVAEGVLKQFTGGDVMQFDRKNQTPISAKPTAKLMCAWNSRPRFKDKSSGLWRRMLLVPFNREVEKHRCVLGMDRAEWWFDQGEVPGILNWAIVGLARLLENKDFSESTVCNDAIAEYREESNPAIQFLNECVSFLPKRHLESELLKDEREQDYITSKNVYQVYREWCNENGIRSMNASNFGKQVVRRFGNIRRRQTSGERDYVYRLLCFRKDFFE